MNYDSRSYSLYEELATIARNRGLNVPASHNSLFQPSENTKEFVDTLYINHLGNNIPIKRPGGKTCKYCEDFHIEHRKAINKSLDLNLGKELEECFQEFINKKFNSMDIGIRCLRADNKKKNMPDFKIVRMSDSKVLLYFEFKAIFRPYIKIKDHDENFECYSHSLTLDLSNGKKLQIQRNYVEDELGVDQVFYVYWYDLPCVKGVYWIPAQHVYEEMDIQTPYNRIHAVGDFNKSGVKVGSTNKIYLPLHRMADFGTFLRRIYTWYHNK